MQHSTIDQPGMEEILCKKRQEFGGNHLHRMVPTVQEATEDPVLLKNKIRLDNEQFDNQNDPPLRTHRHIPEIIGTDNL